jgi:hypothetical protein
MWNPAGTQCTGLQCLWEQYLRALFAPAYAASLSSLPRDALFGIRTTWSVSSATNADGFPALWQFPIWKWSLWVMESKLRATSTTRRYAITRRPRQQGA